MAWLLSDGQVVAPLEVADRVAGRTRGLLGRDTIEGALLLAPARSVHTLGMRFAIDVAYLDRHNRVVDIATMPPQRVGMPRLRARSVLEAAEGSLRRWGVGVGDQLGVQP